MKQYEFEAWSNRDNHRETMRCTARTVRTARSVLSKLYTSYRIGEKPIAVRPPHHILGEVDAS
jgi:hypothetical protein